MHKTDRPVTPGDARLHHVSRAVRPWAKLIHHAALAAMVSSALLLSACGESPEAMLAKAKDLVAKKDFKAAEVQLKSLLQKQDSAEARFLLGTVHAEAADFASAEKEFQRALDSGYDKSKASVAYLDSLFKLARFKDVIAQGASAVVNTPEDKAAVQTLMGRSQLAQGKADEAKANFAAALAAVPDYPAARVAQISLQAGLGDLPGASAEIDKVIARSPKFADALSLKGDIEAAQGHRKEARDFYAKSTAEAPSDRLVRSKLVSMNIEAGDYESAQKELDALKKLGNLGPLPMQMQALIYWRQGKLEAARDVNLLALKNAPDYLPSLSLGAQLYIELKNFEQAESLARKVVAQAPKSPTGYGLLATALLQTGAPDKVLSTVQSAMDKGVKSASLLNIAGEAALRLNDTAKAITYFEQAGKLDPSGSAPKTGIALAHLARGEKERGIGELEKASEGATNIRADMALVAIHMRDRQYDKALAAIDRMEKKSPDSALAANLRGTVLQARGDAAGARAAFETALARDPKFIGAAANLATLDLRERKVDAAKGRFTKLLEKDPRSVEAMLALARIEQGTAAIARNEKDLADAKAGKLVEFDAKSPANSSPAALEWLKKARDTDKSSVPAAIALAGWFMGNQQPKEAVPVLQEALAASPDRIELLDALGTAYMRSDQPAQAMEQFEKILKVKPDSALLQYRMGQLKASRKEYDAALAHLRKSIELEPKAFEPRVALAATLLRTGKADEARSVALALQKENPKSAAGIVLEADVAMAARKFPEAVAAYRRAAAIDKSAAIQIRLNEAVAAGGQAAEADNAVRAMVKERPEDMSLRNYAAQYFVNRGRWADAIEQYKALIAKQPENAGALNNLAWALFQAREPNALETAEKAYALAPKSPAILDTFGVILVERGQAERGLQFLRQVVSAAPKAPELRMHLAEALVKTGDKSGARVELDTLLKDSTEGPIADKARKLRGELG